MPRLFISQEQLDTWVQEERVQLEEDALTLDDGRRYRLVPAVGFCAVTGDEADPHGLVGTVKTKEQLAEMGAEHYPGSVILADVAYEVCEGFVGQPVPR